MKTEQKTGRHFRFDSDRLNESLKSADPSQHAHANFDLLRREIRSRLLHCHRIQQLTDTIAEVIGQSQRVFRVWIESSRTSDRPDDQADFPPELTTLVEQLCRATRTTGQASHSAIEGTDGSCFSCAAIDLNEKSADIICIIHNQLSVDEKCWLDMMHLIADQVAIWKQQQINFNINAQTKQIADTFNLTQAICIAGRSDTAARAVVNNLRLMLHADFAAIALYPVLGKLKSRGEVQLVAISDVESIDKSSELARIAELSCRTVAIAGDQPQNTSGSDDSKQPMPLNQLAKTLPAQLAIGSALKTSQGEIIGSVVLAFSNSNPGNQNSELLERVSPTIANHLNRTIEATQSPFRRLVLHGKKLLASHTTKIITLLFAFIVLVMCIPMPYSVNCDCEIQPVSRRFVPAPYEGILSSCNVKPGDVVKVDQILATMDGRQLRIEKAGLQAELARELKKRDSALALNDIAESQIAAHEIDRLNSQMNQIETRLANLNIRSPIDGIVVAGDLAKVEGAPLEVGQNLFEIAPLDEMLVEVAIPESEIRFVKETMSVDLKLEAFPNQVWTANIERIYPNTEMIDNASVFVAEVRLPNELILLRPGMRGNANVHAHWSPLGWNLFHRWWDSVRVWTIW